MENGPFIVDFPINLTSIYEGFSMAMLNNQMVTIVNGDYFMVYKPTIIIGGPHPLLTKEMPFGSQT